MSGDRIVRSGQIVDEYTGFDGDTLFELTDGTFWLQDVYRYHYQYAYRPQIEIVEDGGRLYLRLAGQTERVAVRQITDVIRSRIDGTFSGWHGNSKYTLANGQTWEQRDSKSRTRTRTNPHVVVYRSGAGWMMKVADTTARVRRL
jgi:hypothetical protein